MQDKLLGVNNVDFDATGRFNMPTIYPIFCIRQILEKKKKDGSTMTQYISYL
jgi:hypothetical protein